MEMFIPGFTQNAGDIAAWGELLFGFRVDCAVGSGHIAISEHNLTEAQLVQLEAVLRNAKPFALSVDKATIRADGEDYATVTVESQANLLCYRCADRMLRWLCRTALGRWRLQRPRRQLNRLWCRPKTSWSMALRRLR